MIGEVHKQASDTRMKLFLADSARLFQIRHSESANPLGSAVQALMELGEQFFARDAGIEFSPGRCNLFSAELVALGIREQAVETARNVAHVEGNGRETAGRSMKLGLGKAVCP